ncbi:GNAT family N-acetyltransferase [Thioclava sp. GXIMD2076]|uniref:GNAT family N-acetyltransferase n=1 Tax=Thioclava sp. GXIMD2076 TaxID=3131931 RepID=UPI0030CC1A06
MTSGTATGFYELIDATWPAAAFHRAGGFVVRDGKGGGSRVSSASLEVPLSEADPEAAIACHRALGQPVKFQIREGHEALDAMLEARGYECFDPSLVYRAPVVTFPQDIPELAAFPHWPPLAVTREIFEEDGIDAARQAVMARAQGPACVILGRNGDRAAGAAFAACAGREAMIHALTTRPEFRRRGVAGHIMSEAARWAGANGATALNLVVRASNTGAIALYERLGMTLQGRYHYRREIL